MELNFTKMHGCGNDYIYFNCMEDEISNKEALAIKLSDRHKGIGGDGIVLICKSSIADAKMRMFNIDGSEGKMCGNAIRCVAKYLYDNKIVLKSSIDIETMSGIKKIEVLLNNGNASEFVVSMGAPILEPKLIPVLLDTTTVVNLPIEILNNQYNITCVSMGNPHCVVFLDDIQSLDIVTIGRAFENSHIFPERVNTEFIKVIDSNTIEMRVWERGSGETMACGTGACAAVVAAVLNGYCKKDTDVTVKLLGGDLSIKYTGDDVLMTGAAVTVFEGIINMEEV